MADGAPAERLGEIIRRQRELSELSMRQFATLAGISNPYLSQIERGLREPSERVLDAIAAALRGLGRHALRAGRHDRRRGARDRARSNRPSARTRA